MCYYAFLVLRNPVSYLKHDAYYSLRFMYAHSLMSMAPATMTLIILLIVLVILFKTLFERDKEDFDSDQEIMV
ncbi:hypothetical protein L596_019466 [Steinernema carpocapsae]|uniref:Uncharacterized protein n=1 Tax=Steinernema carpocapsae TaxID=34508 RepID=A0A4U5MQS2_STECR|nr:hypothetical protein L596_019466 [Steinernema carpocapsae]